MKKALWFVGAVIALGVLFQGPFASAACNPPALGGTGTCAVPTSGQTLIGNASGSYTPTDLYSLFGASAPLTYNASTGIVGWRNSNGYATTTIQSVLNRLSAAGLATYNSSTGVISVSSSTLNLGSASTHPASDFLASSTNLAPSTTIPTSYVSSFNGATGTVTYAPSTTIPTVYVTSFNTRSGAVTLSSGDVTTALGFTPYNSTNPSNFISSSTGSTLYYPLSANPNNYATTTIPSVLNSLSAQGLATYNSSTGVFTVSSSSLSLGTASQHPTSDFLSSSTLYISSFNTRTGAITLASSDVTTALGFTPYSATNPSNFISSSTGNGLYYPLNTNPNGYVTSTATTSPAGSSTQIQFNNGGNFGANVALTFNPSTGIFFVATSSLTTVSVQYFDTVLHADGFSGADLGAQTNAAYAALPSSGGEIVEPIGSFNYATPIVFGTEAKLAMLYCPSGGGGANFSLGGGTTLIYTSSTGIGVTINTGAYVAGGTGITNCDIQGTHGTTASPIIGVRLGGTNGAFSATLTNVTISGWGTGEDVYQNASFITNINTTLNFNGVDLFIESTSGANGENFKYIGGVIGDSNNQGGGATDLYCIDNQLSGNTQVDFIGPSIDDCSYYSNQFGGTANISNFFAVHWENPNGHSYPYIQTLSNQAALVINVSGGDMMNDDTSGMPYYILSGGTVTLNQVLFDSNNNVSTPVTAVVSNQDATSVDVVSWTGITKKGAGATSIYGTVPFSPQGYGTGANSATPNYYLNASGTFIFGVNPQDPSGNKYPTSTGGVSGLTTNYIPLALSSTTVTSSNIYQAPGGAAAGISFDASSSWTQATTATSVSASFTVGTSSNEILFGVAYTTNPVATATYNGVSMTLATSVFDDSANRTLSLFVLPSAATGTHTFLFQTTSTSAVMQGSVISYFGAKQSTSLDAVAIAAVSSTSLNNQTTTLTTTQNNDWAILGAHTTVAAISANSPSRLLIISGSNQTGVLDTNGPITPAGSFSMSYHMGITSGGYTVMGAFAPAPGATSTNNISFGSTSTPATFAINDTTNNSTTFRIGIGATRFGCIEMNDSVSSSTLEYIYTVSGALTATTTKPLFCQ